MATKRITDLALAEDVALDDLLIVRDASAGADKRLAVGVLLGEVEEFTPTVTFVTPGDLSVLYDRQWGRMVRVGSLIHVQILLAFTPTFTTASGVFYVSAPPLPAPLSGNDEVRSAMLGAPYHSDNITYPAGRSMIVAGKTPGAENIRLYAMGDGVSVTSLSVSAFNSGAPVALDFAGSYIAGEG